MSDIVERLRACHGIPAGDPDCCCAEAAAEIERLRTDNAHWQAIASQGIADEHAVRKQDVLLTAEIERLRNALETIADIFPENHTAAAIARRALEGK